MTMDMFIQMLFLGIFAFNVGVLSITGALYAEHMPRWKMVSTLVLLLSNILLTVMILVGIISPALAETLSLLTILVLALNSTVPAVYFYLDVRDREQNRIEEMQRYIKATQYIKEAKAGAVADVVVDVVVAAEEAATEDSGV